jgi:hypothetical protein
MQQGRAKTEKLILLSLFIPFISIFIFGCAQSRIERRTLSTEKIEKFHFSEEFHFLKLHMSNGDAYIFSSWENDNQNKLIKGYGKHLDFNRVIIDSGNYAVSYEGIALVESNKINSSSPLLGLSIMSGISLSVTAFCIINPKACFGSCPTFYICDGNDYKLKAEGFSSSVSPSLEADDVDALYAVKPESNILDIQIRNEALETHVIRYVNILALPKTGKMRIFSTPDGDFYEASNILEIKKAVAYKEDCTKELLYFDGSERFSLADSIDLNKKEIIELEFKNITDSSKGLIIACRQTLLSTFLFYQSLAYMGKNAGYYFSQLERKNSSLKNILKYPGELLTNIEILQRDSLGKWIKINHTGETGPIATDIKIIPLKDINKANDIKLKLRMTRGMWRIDYTAVGDLGRKVLPIVIKPSEVFPDKNNSSDILNLLLNKDSLLVTLPGDRYDIYYKLPDSYGNYEYFIESKGYYLEWIRDVWLAEENPLMVNEMIFNTNQYFKDLAPKYKKIESSMENAFWRSKYVNP